MSHFRTHFYNYIDSKTATGDEVVMTPESKQRPRDYEVMDMVLKRGDAVELARHLSVSPQLIRSWCRPPETEDEYSTGKFGPLARLRTLISMVRDDDLVPDRAFPIGRYVAGLLGGVFVPLPITSSRPDGDLLKRVASVLRENGEAIDATREAWFEKTPGKITEKEHSACVQEIDEAIIALVQLKRWVENNTGKK